MALFRIRTPTQHKYLGDAHPRSLPCNFASYSFDLNFRTEEVIIGLKDLVLFYFLMLTWSFKCRVGCTHLTPKCPKPIFEVRAGNYS